MKRARKLTVPPRTSNLFHKSAPDREIVLRGAKCKGIELGPRQVGP